MKKLRNWKENSDTGQIGALWQRVLGNAIKVSCSTSRKLTLHWVCGKIASAPRKCCQICYPSVNQWDSVHLTIADFSTSSGAPGNKQWLPVLPVVLLTSPFALGWFCYAGDWSISRRVEVHHLQSLDNSSMSTATFHHSRRNKKQAEDNLEPRTHTHTPVLRGLQLAEHIRTASPTIRTKIH